MMKATKTCVLIFLLLIPAINVNAWPIPDTGQTLCYNATAEIPCPAPGQPFYGQDGSYTINPPSYTKLDATGAALPISATTWAMVKDNVTGLTWENKTDDGGTRDKDNRYTWCDRNPATNGGNQGTCGSGTSPVDTEGFINSLNDAKFGGFSDWRLPSTEELKTIVDYGRYSPAIQTAWFPGEVTADYWSSTTYAYDSSHARGFDFSIGTAHNYGKSIALAIRAVRGGLSRSLDHLVINGDGTVTDTATGLMWQQEASSSTMTWEAALAYAEGLPLSGYEDWRLPTLTELQSIVDYKRYNPAIDTTFFPGTMVSSYYWSSTTYISTNAAWYVSFGYGDGDGILKSFSHDVRAVRGGQSGLLGHLIISSPGQADRWNIGEQKAIIWDTAGISGNAKITISRQGGKTGTFETIIESTENDGTYNWTVTGPVSVNCVLKIEPLNDPSKATSQGLFSISGGTVIVNPEPDAMNATAPWTIMGSNSFNWTGAGDLTLNNLAVGNYAIIWGDVPDWFKPSPATETKALTSGGTITFSGTYVQQTTPIIQVTQSILSFGYVPPGSYKDLILVVKNIGGGILTGTVSACPPFSIVSEGNYSLEAGESQQVIVRYTAPLEEGAQTCSFVFTGGGGITVQVKGTNKKAGLPWLLLLLGN